MGSILSRDHKCPKWYKAFSEGRESIKDESRSGTPSTSKTDKNVEKVRAVVGSDRRLTVRMIASELNLNCTTIHQIFNTGISHEKVVYTKRSPLETQNPAHCNLIGPNMPPLPTALSPNSIPLPSSPQRALHSPQGITGRVSDMSLWNCRALCGEE